MGGRVTEPELGRFLTADPFVQDATFTQSLNRYSYVLNNPLSYTDPSGFFFKKASRAFGGFASGVFNPIGSAVKVALKETLGTVHIDAQYLHAAFGIAACSFGPETCVAYSFMSTLAVGGSLGDALAAAALTSAAVYGGEYLAGPGEGTSSQDFGFLESSGADCLADCPGGEPTWFNDFIRIAIAASSISDIWGHNT